MKTYFVDSFNNEPFKGNPAAVCLIEHELSEKKMLTIAQEFGLSETAFVGATEKEGTFTIRFFSPIKEIPLCGHATLAAGKVLFKSTTADQLHFINVEGLDLPVSRNGEEIVMEFPVYDTVDHETPVPMLQALGLSEIIHSAFSEKNKIILIEMSDTNILAALRPDFHALVRSITGINGVLVTARSADAVYDYHYRYFWPWAGTNEDPVTGGVQTFLAKYWSLRLNKKAMRAFQSSARTGYMNVEIINEKVFISSEAVIILEGELVV